MTTSYTIDEICPAYIGEERFKLTLNNSEVVPLAHTPLTIDIDYSNAGMIGASLPIELIFQGPVAGQRITKLFTTSLPTSVILSPFSKGRHLVVIREIFHNRWQGKLFFEATGADPIKSEIRR